MLLPRRHWSGHVTEVPLPLMVPPLLVSYRSMASLWIARRHGDGRRLANRNGGRACEQLTTGGAGCLMVKLARTSRVVLLPWDP